jgi:hypothetical protein
VTVPVVVEGHALLPFEPGNHAPCFRMRSKHHLPFEKWAAFITSETWGKGGCESLAKRPQPLAGSGPTAALPQFGSTAFEAME